MVFNKVICVISLVLLSGCNDNTRTRVYGGTTDINLEPNTKLVNVTWKNNNIWVLTRPMDNNDIPVDSEFKEYSNFGVFNGTIRLHESKK